MILKILNKLKFWKKKEELTYPIPHGIIDYTDVAKLKNIKDNQNKIIKVFKINKYGNLEIKRYKYSEPLAFILEKRGIPIFDKTKMKQKFEVVVKRNLGEIVYTK